MSVNPRGGFGWDGPQQFGGGRQQGKTDAMADMIVRALQGGKITTDMMAAMLDAGTISQAVIDRVAEKIVGVARAPASDDEIVMIEIDGVFMSPADAHEARLAIGRR
jgi:predicted metal-dependent phosphotriesterase family hydrolase